MKPRSAGGMTQDRGRGRFQTRPCPHGPRRCPPEVEDRLGRNADRQPGHCGIVAQVLGCGRMTPAPTSKPDGHPQDVGATLVVALAPRGCPFKVRANPVNIRQTSDRFVERPRLQHDDREELTDSERCTYQKPPGRPMVWRHRRRCILNKKLPTSFARANPTPTRRCFDNQTIVPSPLRGRGLEPAPGLNRGGGAPIKMTKT